MQFRLTYSGPLYSTGNDENGPNKVEHKHELRLAFSPQLKRLWEIVPFLRTGERSGPSVLLLEGDMGGDPAPDYNSKWLAKKHEAFGWKFVPLVTSALGLWCSIDVLLLRPGKVGKILNRGDLDGRLKTLIDALAIPDDNQRYESRAATNSPLYTLLENDRLVSKLIVETDELLELDEGKLNENFVRLIVSVNIKPHEMHLGNIQFS